MNRLQWAVSAFFFVFLSYILYRVHHLSPDTWALLQHQWLAVILFPSACFATLVVVLILDKVSGTMEISGLGFSFKGAAAPVIIWGFLVLIMAGSLALLWQPDRVH